jgi:spore germination protein GerM
MPQLVQQGGRSNRTKGACYITYFLNTDEDKEQVKLRLTRTIASELNSTVELTHLLRKINPWYKSASATIRRGYTGFATLLAEQVILRQNALPTTV